ncbi:hypothetical protein KIN20_030598 [Parelaphostrongylus tenuis]|uniref:Uncharacterized protein n=1 Tax=Parelaphostrongylus tenuis TaxID=148309 RepID=A0AAD5R4E3_PARTN|nr:hypothetical protein KIN20_030598 [Parelaphostrongylus tenuis]
MGVSVANVNLLHPQMATSLDLRNGPRVRYHVRSRSPPWTAAARKRKRTKTMPGLASVNTGPPSPRKADFE